MATRLAPIDYTTGRKKKMSYLLQVTEANHGDNAFYVLGGAGFPSEESRAKNVAGISRDLEGHVCDKEDRCYSLDIIDPQDQFSITDDFEISESTAHALLGVDDFEPLRQAERDLETAVSSASSTIHA